MLAVRAGRARPTPCSCTTSTASPPQLPRCALKRTCFLALGVGWQSHLCTRATHCTLLTIAVPCHVSTPQATSVACGAYHTAALLIPNSSASQPASPSSSCGALTSLLQLEGQGARHSLYMFGRGARLAQGPSRLLCGHLHSGSVVSRVCANTCLPRLTCAGFHGQLGTNDFTSQKTPVHVSLGFKPCQVRVRRVILGICSARQPLPTASPWRARPHSCPAACTAA